MQNVGYLFQTVQNYSLLYYCLDNLNAEYVVANNVLIDGLLFVRKIALFVFAKLHNNLNKREQQNRT